MIRYFYILFLSAQAMNIPFTNENDERKNQACYYKKSSNLETIFEDEILKIKEDPEITLFWRNQMVHENPRQRKFSWIYNTTYMSILLGILTSIFIVGACILLSFFK